MKVLLAPDKFKGSLTAAQVIDHLSAGIRSVTDAADLIAVPVADGGDGTLQASVRAGFTHVPVHVRGPRGNRSSPGTPAAATPPSSSWPTPAGWSGCPPACCAR